MGALRLIGRDPDRSLARFAPHVAGLVALAVFVRTLLPGVAAGDWAEMQVVPHVLGIAHPTGYPTYILLAWAAQLVPIGSIALRGNLLSAVLTSLAVASITVICLRLGLRPAISALAALALGAVGTVWAAAIVAEVNPLHLLLVALLLHRALVWSERRAPRDLAIGGLLLGLALGNHLLTAVIAPFIALFVVWTGRQELRAQPWLLAVPALTLLAGLSVYLYIPLRASMNPPLAYNHPTTWEGIEYLVTGSQFRSQFGFLSGEGPRVYVDSLGDLFQLLAAQATPILPLLGLAGLVVLLRTRTAFGALALAVLVMGTYVWATYGRLEHYLLVPFLILSIGVAAAIDAIAGAVEARVGGPATVFARLVVPVATLAFVAGLYAANWPNVDRSTDRRGDDYVDQVLGALPEGSVILTGWDFSTPLWYARWADERRPDIQIIDDSNIVYDGWGTRENAVGAFVCRRPVYMLRVDEGELLPTRALFRVEPVARILVAAGPPPGRVERTLWRIEPQGGCEAASGGRSPILTTHRPRARPATIASSAPSSPSRSTSVRSSSSPRGRRSVAKRCQIRRRSSIATLVESMPRIAAPRRMNGRTVVLNAGPPALPQLATAACGRRVRRMYGIVGPPTASIAPAQRPDSSGLALSAVTSSRVSVAVAPSSRRRTSSSGFPVAAHTSWPRLANIPTANRPRPPDAPVTRTGPSPGLRPWSSRAMTLIAAVKPAVPIAIACLGVRPSGSGTIQPAGTRAISEWPPWRATPMS